MKQGKDIIVKFLNSNMRVQISSSTINSNYWIHERHTKQSTATPIKF